MIHSPGWLRQFTELCPTFMQEQRPSCRGRGTCWGLPFLGQIVNITFTGVFSNFIGTLIVEDGFKMLSLMRCNVLLPVVFAPFSAPCVHTECPTLLVAAPHIRHNLVHDVTFGLYQLKYSWMKPTEERMAKQGCSTTPHKFKLTSFCSCVLDGMKRFRRLPKTTWLQFLAVCNLANFAQQRMQLA